MSEAGAAGALTRPRVVHTFYVSPHGTASGSDQSCATAKLTNIIAVIKKAVADDHVVVCKGTYSAKTSFTAVGLTVTTGVLVNKAITLSAMAGAAINAKGLDNGITIFGGSGATVSGSTVSGAFGEGILAAAVGQVTIKGNTVVHNDNGTAKSPWAECQAHGQVPGDCGEGIHLPSVASSKAVGNRVMFNSGGVLLSDEFGPTHGNLVSGNVVGDNASDCGITLVSHNTGALSKAGIPQPKTGGVYKNTIKANVIVSNDTTGFGGGIIFASGVSGGGSYDNTATGNEIVGNAISGASVHRHAPLSDVSGNVISSNWIGTDNLPGDPGTGDMATTGVLVDNGWTHATIKVTVTGNTIAWNTYGICDDAGGLIQSGNTFLHVKVNVKH